MTSANAQPDPADETTGQADEQEPTVGGLTVEDDPEGTVDPSDLAGTASEDDEDVS